MTGFGAVIDPDGTVVFRHVDGDDDLWTTCGGWVQAIPMHEDWPGACMYANDEAERLGMPVNALASSVSGLWPRSVVRGTVVLTGDGGGDLPMDVAVELRDLAHWFARAREVLGG